jgi:hypothetical protein
MPCVFNIGTRWRWAVSFTPRLLYPRDKQLWCPLDTRLIGPYRRSGICGEEKSSCPCSKSNPDSSVFQLVFTMPTEPSWILCQRKHFPISHWLLKYMKCRGLAYILPPPSLFRAPVRHGALVWEIQCKIWPSARSPECYENEQAGYIYAYVNIVCWDTEYIFTKCLICLSITPKKGKKQLSYNTQAYCLVYCQTSS